MEIFKLIYLKMKTKKKKLFGKVFHFARRADCTEDWEPIERLSVGGSRTYDRMNNFVLIWESQIYSRYSSKNGNISKNLTSNTNHNSDNLILIFDLHDCRFFLCQFFYAYKMNQTLSTCSKRMYIERFTSWNSTYHFQAISLWHLLS